MSLPSYPCPSCPIIRPPSALSPGCVRSLYLPHAVAARSPPRIDELIDSQVYLDMLTDRQYTDTVLPFLGQYGIKRDPRHWRTVERSIRSRLSSSPSPYGTESSDQNREQRFRFRHDLTPVHYAPAIIPGRAGSRHVAEIARVSPFPVDLCLRLLFDSGHENTPSGSRIGRMQ